MLEFVYLLVALAALALVSWDGMRREPPGAPRWLWLAAVLALGGALATNGADLPAAVTVGAWLVAIGLGIAAGHASERTEHRG